MQSVPDPWSPPSAPVGLKSTRCPSRLPAPGAHVDFERALAPSAPSLRSGAPVEVHYADIPFERMCTTDVVEGIVRGACGALPSWMIDNLAEALHALVFSAVDPARAAKASPRVVQALHAALLSPRLPVGCMRACDTDATQALEPLLAAKRPPTQTARQPCGGLHRPWMTWALKMCAMHLMRRRARHSHCGLRRHR